MTYRAFATVLLLISVLAGLNGDAGAHGTLAGSAPANGARLEKSPRLVMLRFNEPVASDGAVLTVRDESGARVDSGDAGVDKRHPEMAVVSLPPLPNGRYTVEYRVTSLDGHPMAGHIAYSVGVAPPPVDLSGPAYAETAAADDVEITLRLEPLRVGVTYPTVTLRRKGGEAERGAAVSLQATMSGHEMDLQPVRLPEQAAGVYRSEQLIFGMEGPWNIEVSVRTSQGREVRRDFAVTVPPVTRP